MDYPSSAQDLESILSIRNGRTKEQSVLEDTLFPDSVFYKPYREKPEMERTAKIGRLLRWPAGQS
jgi:hypothetical protein